MAAGTPVRLLNEAHGHIVTLELVTGEVYRGKLIESEDNMNLQLTNLTITSRNGSVTHLNQVYVRGSKIKFIMVPEILKNAPMFNKDMVKPKPPIRGPRRK